MRFIKHLICIIFISIQLSTAQKLLILFLDGFRWDYIKDTNLSGFMTLKKHGSYINKVVPVFPADCHPNIYSIFTGLYPQYHGVIGNRVYSSVSKREFDHSNVVHRRDVHEWVDAEPLWVTAKNQGKSSFLYHLPICDSSFGPLSPSYCVPYHDESMTMDVMNRSVKDAVRVLRSGVAHMAVVYNDQLDRLTHSYGPQSARLSEELLPSIDSIIQSLLVDITGSEINLVLLSDHGMAQIAMARQIFLERIILRSEVDRVLNQGGYVGIWPKHGCYGQVRIRLAMASKDKNSHFKMYTHRTLPAHWNVFSPTMTPPFLLVADPGYFISSQELEFPIGSDYIGSGWHGYAPEHDEMASPFLAFGPRVDMGTTISVAHVTELYQLLAHLLDVEPHSHNGTLDFLNSFRREVKLDWSPPFKMIADYSGSSSLLRYRSSVITLPLALIAWQL